MSADTDLRDQALAYLRATTSKYSKTLETNLSSNWGKAFAALAKIGTQPVPPPVPVPVPPPVNPYQALTGLCAYRTTDFDLIASLGVKHVRMDNPSAATIDLARTKGLEVLPIAGYCPWPDLNGGKSSHTPPLAPLVPTWAKRLVDQWRGMTNPPKVFEPWNEPWNFWDIPKDPALYLAMVQAFAQEAWAVWPNATILVSADPNDITLGGVKIHWRDALLAADTGKFLTDPRIQPTVHIYCGSAAPDARSSNPCQWDFDRYNCVRDAFKAHGHPNPVPWPTELGWETSTAGGRPERTDLVTEQQQADYTIAAFKKLATAGVGRRVRVRGQAYFDELDDYVLVAARQHAEARGRCCESAAGVTMVASTLTLADAARMMRDARDNGYQATPLGPHVDRYIRWKRSEWGAAASTLRAIEYVLAPARRRTRRPRAPDFEPPVGTERLREFWDYHYGTSPPAPARTASRSCPTSSSGRAVNGSSTVTRRSRSAGRKSTTHRSSCSRSRSSTGSSRPDLPRRRARCRLILSTRSATPKSPPASSSTSTSTAASSSSGKAAKRGRSRSSTTPSGCNSAVSNSNCRRSRTTTSCTAPTRSAIVCPLDEAEESPRPRPWCAAWLPAPDHPRPQPPISSSSMHRWWYACSAARRRGSRDVTAGMNMHRGRHTAITDLLRTPGVNLKHAQLLAGHASIQTTADEYAGFDTGDVAHAYQLKADWDAKD
jgi:hypothetical protein